ncbi:hypothetical protein SLEP1_g17428 [Rubroshorea leprosula]|uniref:Uncharacterized protein n=1 Tax=Rubroshorea leprosula TaxID=152421 RepID=A0AAV5J043_9ROSI|nr:hypothetical protein SLEP1_g17428 [Rubroshorea leprosula]
MSLGQIHSIAVPWAVPNTLTLTHSFPQNCHNRQIPCLPCSPYISQTPQDQRHERSNQLAKLAPRRMQRLAKIDQKGRPSTTRQDSNSNTSNKLTSFPTQQHRMAKEWNRNTT